MADMDVARIGAALTDILPDAMADNRLEACQELLEWSKKWDVSISDMSDIIASDRSEVTFAREFAKNDEAVKTLAQAIEKHVAIVPTVDEIVRGVIRAIRESVYSYPAERSEE